MAQRILRCVAFAAYAFTGIGMQAPTPARAEPIVVDIQVIDEPGDGFDDPVLGPLRLDAIHTAADVFGSFFVASFPGETVVVQVEMVPSLGDYGALTQVTATTQSTGVGEVTVQRPIAEHLAGQELFDGVDGLIQFSLERDFYLETTGDPGDRLEFVTLAMHELGHVFGFISNLDADGTYDAGPFGALPNFYDLFVWDADDFPVFFLSPEERVAATTSGDGLFWGGSAGVAGNGGMPPNLSAPTEFTPGTSVVHVSETFFPGDILMDAGQAPGEVIRTLSSVERGMFQDMGWTLAPEPAASGAFAIGALGILGLGRSRRSGLRMAGPRS